MLGSNIIKSSEDMQHIKCGLEKSTRRQILSYCIVLLMTLRLKVISLRNVMIKVPFLVISI